MKNLTEGLEADTIGGFNSMIEKQKNVEGEVLISTVLFDHESVVIHDRVPLAEIKPMTAKDYEVRGSTALLDAIGDAVKHIKTIHKYAREEDRPSKTLFVITTDGEENSSERYSYKQIKKLVEAQKELGWEFIFLGANIDAVKVASSIGVSASRAVNYHSDKVGTRKSFAAVSNFVASARAPMPSDDGDEWRKELDEDFEERNQGGNISKNLAVLKRLFGNNKHK